MNYMKIFLIFNCLFISINIMCRDAIIKYHEIIKNQNKRLRLVLQVNKNLNQYLYLFFI
jgi:hypothetical protein